MIVLDTHALVWWVSDTSRVGAKARRLIDGAVKAGEQLSVSCISVWEIAMLVARGRLELTIDVHSWMAHVQALPYFTFVPVDNAIAMRSVHLEGFAPRDPADRMIVATALGLNATLVTADKALRSYSALRTSWD